MAWPARRRWWCWRDRTAPGPRVGSGAARFSGSARAVGCGDVAPFGIGSMVGMGSLSRVIAVPLAASARWLTWANSGLQGAVGVITIAIGVTTIITTLFA